MLGFVAVDRCSETVAIWLVSRMDPTEASGTNAVVVDLADGYALKRMYSLTRERVIIVTSGSDLIDLPISDGRPTALLGEFIDAARTRQRAIVEAVRSHATFRKGQKLVELTLPAEPQFPENWPETYQDRVLEPAGLVGRAWTNWLVSDDERLRRTTQSRTGRIPWIMPGELNQPEPLALPPALAKKFRLGLVGPFPG